MAGRVVWTHEWDDRLALAQEWESSTPDLLPAPRLTALDIGCGEGRLPRDLTQRGYRVAPAGDTGLLGASFDMVVAFHSLHDVDALDRRLPRSRGCCGRGGGSVRRSFLHIRAVKQSVA